MALCWRGINNFSTCIAPDNRTTRRPLGRPSNSVGWTPAIYELMLPPILTMWITAVWYLGRMLYRTMAVGLIQTVVLSFGLTGLSDNAAEAAANPPVAMVTNVVAQRAVRDVLQTLLAVTPADKPVGLGAQTVSFESTLSSAAQSNTIWTSAVASARAAGVTLITNTFAGFVPGSLAEAIWAGFHTNGRSTRIWEFWQLPPGWPNIPPVLRWNTNNLMWGRKGMTGFSQVNESMGGFGQGALTLLTRRHAYLRGHSMGANGLHPEKVGVRVWYCTLDNHVIERKVKLLLVRAQDPRSPGDYSIALFDADLPPEIEPMRVADAAKVERKYLLWRSKPQTDSHDSARGLCHRVCSRVERHLWGWGFRRPDHVTAAGRTDLL